MPDGQHFIDVARRFPETTIEPGLREAEVDSVQEKFGFKFPPDLRAMLMAGLPVGGCWPNWRSALADNSAAAEENVRGRLAWPLEGMLFDVRNNAFWDPHWGLKPAEPSAAITVATAAVQAAPVLIPIWAHRYLPAEPCIAGNVVLSVYQMDIIEYGSDLLSYLKAERNGWNAEAGGNGIEIRCWTRWMKLGWGEESA